MKRTVWTQTIFSLLCLLMLIAPNITLSVAYAAPPLMPLSACFLNRSNSTQAQIESEASQQALSSPKYSSGYTGHEIIFEGDFTPANNDVLLAVFADDGADVSRAELDAGNRIVGGFIPLVGRFGVGQHLPDLAQSFQLIDVPWTAGKSYRIRIHYKNLSYNLSRDVDGISLFAFNGGGEVRDSVWPQDGEGVLRVFKDAALNQEVTGDLVGGTVYAAFEIRVGARQKLSSSSATVRVTDLWPNYTTEAKSFDLSFNLTSGTGWQKRVGDSGSWSDANEAPSTPNDGDEPISYRAKAAWNTRTQPLGNNGNHSLAAVSELSFAPIAPGDAYNGGPVAVDVNVKNLVIKSVTPNEYFLVQEGQTAPVNFGVELEDYDYSQPYTLTLTIRYTMAAKDVTKTIVRQATGRNHSILWDLTNSQNEAINTNGGYFTYDLSAEKTGDSKQVYRSPFIDVVEDQISLETDSDDDFVVNYSGQFHALFAYKLNEQPLPQSVNVRFYQNLFSVGEATGLSDQSRWPDAQPAVDAWVNMPDSSSIRGIMEARDNRIAEHRNHAAKPLLNFNSGSQSYGKNTAFTFNLTGSQNSRFIEWQRVNTNPVQLGPITIWNNTLTDWHHANSWVANSGTENINSDNSSHCWSANGPVPASSERQNTVEENEDTKRWRINVSNDYKTWTNSTTDRPGLTWEDPNGNPKVYNDRQGKYRQWRFAIQNENGGDVHHPNATFPNIVLQTEASVEGGSRRDYRQTIRLHEDGSQLGTAGCTGVTSGTMASVWTRLQNLKTAKLSSDGTPNERRIYIPYMIYDRQGCTTNSTWQEGRNFIVWRSSKP